MLDDLLNLLMDMYLSRQLSVPMQIRVLDALKNLCKKAKCLSLSPGKYPQFVFCFRLIVNDSINLFLYIVWCRR